RGAGRRAPLGPRPPQRAGAQRKRGGLILSAECTERPFRPPPVPRSAQSPFVMVAAATCLWGPAGDHLKPDDGITESECPANTTARPSRGTLTRRAPL